MMVSHETHHAAAHDVCQPNSVREVLVDQMGNTECVHIPADPKQDWERYCFEQGFRTLEEACGPYEPSSSQQQRKLDKLYENKGSYEERSAAVSLAIKLYEKAGASAERLLVTAEAIRQYLTGEITVPLTTDDGEELFPVNCRGRQFDNTKDVVPVCDRPVSNPSSTMMENAVGEFVLRSGNTGRNLPDQGFSGCGDIIGHRNSSSVVGLDNSTLDEAGGCSNAPASKSGEGHAA